MEKGPLLDVEKELQGRKAKYGMRLKTFLVTRKIFAQKHQHLSWTVLSTDKSGMLGRRKE